MSLWKKFVPGPRITPLRLALLGIAGAFILVAVTVSLYLAIRTPIDVAGSLAESTARAFREAFNFTPRISIDQTVVFEQNTPIAELATVKRDLWTEYTWTHTWIGSTKKIVVRGVFTAKAGFDLHKPFHIDIRRDPLHISTSIPPAELLSLDLKEYKLMEDEDGWWNKLTPADRQQAVRGLLRVARDKAATSGICEEAQRTVEERIQDIVERNNRNIAGLE